MLTGKQKRHLRSLAHHVTPVTQVGKGGVSANMIEQLNLALESKELIKVSILQNCEEDKDVVAKQLAEGTGAELVQLIGKQVVLYKESTENKQIELP
ncbi:ribosome assembly RNA-binding protein YhbY [Tumebacillus sp. ITR2]|uniref:Ribosome assembly RNA-binding protein YhbY n=1 Tax=Tumebacillus amylolyticus TaxID=2801339 RepID=A0ABS1JAQ1_9BACL|nr:ribosome assembly RNA-binding protein YhbY [Tumebacillus amylolyticus]MBL0387329.1 ribosome assembly RNA-binding protein YhbY [Tumebacillus amylolyticus]